VWVPEFFGDTALVNGKVFPFLEVEPRRYRFRILNGCNSRFLQIALSSGQTFLQIGAEGGFLPRPVQLAQILLAPAERADVIVDFSGHENQNIILTNDAPAPFPGGGEFVIPQIMQFRVKQHCSDKDPDLDLGENLNSVARFLPLAVSLETEPLHHEPPIAKVRYLTLTEELDAQGNPIRLLLDGLPFSAPATEISKLNTTEIWNFINLTGDNHPIHLHLVTFHVLDRQPFDVNVYNATRNLVFTGPPVPRAANEAGLKDTVRTPPGEVTRIKVSFTDFTGNYVWHCHILEHEDNDMMRPLQVIP
jgi:spore coat protein A